MVVPKDMEVEVASVGELVIAVEQVEVDMEVVVELEVEVAMAEVVKKEDMMVDMHRKQRKEKKKLKVLWLK
ncbi:hypothetical protein OV760_27345 [Salmonella enterica subsp. enterica serovar 1,4,[5],12:i:-]|nr:hypothetical protein [Salmonella enterica subsp. enterica serovar 1,4,[5],12:i:-]